MVLTSAMAAWGKDKLHSIPQVGSISGLVPAKPLIHIIMQAQEIIARMDHEAVNPVALIAGMVWLDVRFYSKYYKRTF
jgi:hypothetical protein